MTKTAWGNLTTLAVGSIVYYAADTRTALALIVVFIVGAIAHFDRRLDDASRNIEAIVRRLDNTQ